VGTYLKNRNYGNISIFRQFGIVGTYTIGIVALVIRNYGILPFWPRLWLLPPKRKKLQLEPILTNYGLISSSGHLEDAYMSLNCLKRLNHGKKWF
jgi:hypothetical protein